MISLIVAMAQNRVIGDKNSIPWHIPGELPRFKRITSGHPIIMGRKTYESIGRPLPNRLNIVITRNMDFHVDGVVVVRSLEEAIEKAKKYFESRIKNQESRNETHSPHPSPLPQERENSEENNNMEIFIIGGGEIFKQAMGIADKLYLTIIHKDVVGDTYFPEYENVFTKEVFREEHEEADYTYTFLELEKQIEMFA